MVSLEKKHNRTSAQRIAEVEVGENLALNSQVEFFPVF
jgi:hypothetical protein